MSLSTGFQPYSRFIASSSKDWRYSLDQEIQNDPRISKGCRGLALCEQRQKAGPALNLTDPRLERCRGSNGPRNHSRLIILVHVNDRHFLLANLAIDIIAIVGLRQLCSPLWHTFRRLIDQVQAIHTKHAFPVSFSRFNMIALKPI